MFDSQFGATHLVGYQLIYDSSSWYNYHLLTETEGNSVFCGPETVDVSRGEAEGNIDGRGSTKHTAFPRSQSISVLLLCYKCFIYQ